MTRYLFISVGRNVGEWAAQCLESIATQQGDWRAVVVDDASTDDTRAHIDKTIDGLPHHIAQRFEVWTNPEPMGAMYNQAAAWRSPFADSCQYAAFVDLDDWLTHDHVLTTIEAHTRRGALVTYGNYQSVPHSATCPAVRPYPPAILRSGTIRRFIRDQHGGFRMNHIRCCSMPILRAMTDYDLQDDNGQWWETGPDSCVMLNAIEMAGTRVAVINEVLLSYRSDNPESEWRAKTEKVVANHAAQLNRPPKARLR